MSGHGLATNQQKSALIVFRNLLNEVENQFVQQVAHNKVLQEDNDFFRKGFSPMKNGHSAGPFLSLQVSKPARPVDELLPMVDHDELLDIKAEDDLITLEANMPIDALDIDLESEAEEQRWSGAQKHIGFPEPENDFVCLEKVKVEDLKPRESRVDFNLKEDARQAEESKTSWESQTSNAEDNGCIVTGMSTIAEATKPSVSSWQDSEGDNGEAFPAWFNPAGNAAGFDDRARRMKSIDPQALITVHLDNKPERDRFMLSPLGRFRLSWDIFWCLALLLECFITPIDLVFIETGYMPESWVIATYITLVIFCIDIVLSFFTGYIVEGNEILERSKVIKAYLSGWFWFDILVTIPWSDFIDVDQAETSSTARASKAFRAQKLFKLMRFVKVLRQFNTAKQARQARAVDKLMKSRDSKPLWELIMLWLTEVLKPLKVFGTPMQISAFLLLISHFHGSAWAWLRDDWQPTTDIDLAFNRYWQSVWWAFSVFTFGNPPTQATTMILRTFDILMLTERLVMIFLATLYVVFQAMNKHEDDASHSLRSKYAMEYLKNHDVNIKTQVQMLFSVNETGATRKMLYHFEKLMEDGIPQNLQRQVREELWGFRLRSLGLLEEVNNWNPLLMAEMCQHIREESYASRVVLFKEGDAGGTAYYILSGDVLIFNLNNDNIPPFRKDMWLGERALVNPGLRRSGTGVMQSTASLMVVPAELFHSLLEKYELLDRFHEHCSAELWKGLCGRCGLLGDHFGDECPFLEIVETQPRRTSIGRRLFQTKRINKLDERSKSSRCARDLKMYIQIHKLEKLYPVFNKLEIWTLESAGEHSEELLLQASKDAETRLTEKEQALFKPETLKEFHESVIQRTKKMLLKKVDAGQHFIFLSHYKAEAGTEAALMRGEFEALIKEDAGHPAKPLEAPVFLDSEDLTDLRDLCNSVINSHNLVIMLTKGILTRPWCVVEIATAVQHHVALVPVKIFKPTADDFMFPDEQFYKDMIDGKILGKDGTEVVTKEGFDMEFVCEAIRSVFKRIALPYSPHKSAAIRKTELQAIFKQCQVRGVDKAATRSSSMSSDNSKRPSVPS